MPADPKPVPDDLRRLAAAHGVATSYRYRNERREPVQVDAAVVIRVLGLLEVPAATAADRAAELAKFTEHGRTTLLAPTLSVRLTGTPHAVAGAALLVSEDGTQVAPDTPCIDHDLVWAAKRAALELPWRSAGRPSPLDVSSATTALADWATYCALAERHGGRWRRWPEPLRDVRGAAVAAARRELAPRVDFHAWVQLQCAEQLAAVRGTARTAGMALGVLHDLPVGVDAEGADAWELADVAAGPAGRHRLLRTARYAARHPFPRRRSPDRPCRGAVAAVVDPTGRHPDLGTYVHYDAEVMLAALALEAHRAGAVVVGEDLGTIEPEVTEALAANEMARLGGLVVHPRRVRAGAAAAARRRVAGARRRQPVHPRPAAHRNGIPAR